MRGSWLTFTAAVMLLSAAGCGSDSPTAASTADPAEFCPTLIEFGTKTVVLDDPAATKALWDEQAALTDRLSQTAPEELRGDWQIVLAGVNASRARLEQSGWTSQGDPAPDTQFGDARGRLAEACNIDDRLFISRP